VRTGLDLEDIMKYAVDIDQWDAFRGTIGTKYNDKIDVLKVGL
jgi:hypothetical protein